MAYLDIRVNVPNGDKCEYCSYNPRGTVVCLLFDEFIEEDDNGHKIKCNMCKEMMIEDDENE